METFRNDQVFKKKKKIIIELNKEITKFKQNSNF